MRVGGELRAPKARENTWRCTLPPLTAAPVASAHHTLVGWVNPSRTHPSFQMCKHHLYTLQVCSSLDSFQTTHATDVMLCLTIDPPYWGVAFPAPICVSLNRAAPGTTPPHPPPSSLRLVPLLWFRCVGGGGDAHNFGDFNIYKIPPPSPMSFPFIKNRAKTYANTI